jgi:hypothetical protein
MTNITAKHCCWLMKNVLMSTLTNQFSVKVQKNLCRAARDVQRPCPATATHGDREAGRNIAIQKIPRPFRGSFSE